MATHRYAFIGAGRMASALASGIVDAGLASAEQIAASDPSTEVRETFASSLAGATVGDDNAKAADSAEIVVLAVKPQIMPAALKSVSPAKTDGPLFVSIAAGFPLSSLEAGLGGNARVVRVMPNTPSMVGCGVSGYCGGRLATTEDLQQVKQMLAAVGAGFELPEHLLDAVTGLSGSGPAFVYSMIEAMSEGGTKAGLPDDVALQLAARTVAGAAQMVLTTGVSPAELRNAVTSPGGTTLAGLNALEQGGMRAAVLAAVEAATNRSRELGQV